ncbi:minor capsid protein [Plantibacter sp. YIM 135249]|uniref:minor capsid protein n=1 Tax=Plantibacter sp. YIM 135249 TaxID=3423918 RepID=UPI003D32A57D
MADTYLRPILTGLAELTHAAGIGVYSEDGYPEDMAGFAVQFQQTPEFPARCITWSYYDATDRTDVRLSSTFVQALVRSPDLLEAVDKVDALYERFHRAAHFDVGSVRISNMARISNGYLGFDDNGRHLFSSNFRLTGTRAFGTDVTAG